MTIHEGKMTTSKDTKAGKEGDKVNVIFLILASSDYLGIKSCRKKWDFVKMSYKCFVKLGFDFE